MERRVSTRVSVGIGIQIRLSDQITDAQIMNLSMDGMFVKTPLTSSRTALLLITNTQHNEELVLQFSLGKESEPCIAAGRVAWRSDLGFGIDFTNVNEAFEIFTDRLIEADSLSYQDKVDLLSSIQDPVIQLKKD
jgi:PilZ domain-containing protein